MFHHFHHFLLILHVSTAFKAESRPLLQSEWPVLDLAQGWFHKVHPDLRSALVYHQFAPWVLRCHFWPFPNHQITCHNTPVQRCRPTWAISSHRISVFLAWKKGILEFRIMEAPLSSPTTWAEHMLLSCRYRSWRKLYAHWFAGLDVLTSSLGHWSLIPALGVYVWYRWTRHCSPRGHLHQGPNSATAMRSRHWQAIGMAYKETDSISDNFPTPCTICHPYAHICPYAPASG